MLGREFFLHRQVPDPQQLAPGADDAGPDVVLAILGDRDGGADKRAAIQVLDLLELPRLVDSQLVVEANPEPLRMVLPERGDVLSGKRIRVT